MEQSPSWLLPGILCAFFYALQGAIIKILLGKGLNRSVTTWLIFLSAFPLMLSFLFVTGIPRIQHGFVAAFVTSFAINLLAMYLLVSAIEKTGISQVYVYLSFTPLYILLTGYVLLKETPSLFGVIGILFMFAGTYYINLPEKCESWFEPFRIVRNDTGSFTALIVALLWSVSAPVDKIAVQNSSIIFYLTTFNMTFILAYLPVILTRNNHRNVSKITGVIPHIIILGLTSFLMIFFQFKAILATDVSYVISMKRGGFLFSMMLGTLLFNESITKRTAVGGIILAAGLASLAFA